jgi:hypothetical protein
LAIHNCCHLDHFHPLVTSCVPLLLMNNGLLYSSLTNVLLGIINKSCNFNFLVQPATHCPLELVSNYSQKLGQTFILWWYTLCILAHYFLMPNIPL